MRHLLEAFVQMRYLRRHLDRFEGHVAGRQRVTFKTMFDDLSPGFYGKYYGQRLSRTPWSEANPAPSKSSTTAGGSFALLTGSVETTPPVLREAS